MKTPELVVFTGWDAYKYTPLNGAFQLLIDGLSWQAHDPDNGFNCGCTYRFIPEEPPDPKNEIEEWDDKKAHDYAVRMVGVDRGWPQANLHKAFLAGCAWARKTK